MNILIVEDDLQFQYTVAEALSELGNVTCAKTLSEGLRKLRTQSFQLIILDYHLPDGNSVSLSDYAAAFCPGARIILLTGSAAFARGEVSRFAPGIDWVLRKPIAMADLLALAEYATRSIQEEVAPKRLAGFSH